MLLLVVKILAVIVLLICLGFIAYWAAAVIKGDCVLKVEKTKKTPFKVVDMGPRSVTLACTIPIKNVGRQLGTIMDAFVRTYLPFEQYDEARITAHLTDNDVPRDDDYWQAYIVDPGKSKKFLITLEIKGKGDNILRDLETFPEIAMDIQFFRAYVAVLRDCYDRFSGADDIMVCDVSACVFLNGIHDIIMVCQDAGMNRDEFEFCHLISPPLMCIHTVHFSVLPS